MGMQASGPSLIIVPRREQIQIRQAGKPETARARGNHRELDYGVNPAVAQKLRQFQEVVAQPCYFVLEPLPPPRRT